MKIINLIATVLILIFAILFIYMEWYWSLLIPFLGILFILNDFLGRSKKITVLSLLFIVLVLTYFIYTGQYDSISIPAMGFIMFLNDIKNYKKESSSKL